jgi:hypothetical protein
MKSENLSPLMDTSGEFKFLDKYYETHTFSDFRDIPDSLEILEIICFLPNIPPPPHTVQQHEDIHMWDLTFNKLLEDTYACRN